MEKAEFDKFANAYREECARNIRASGESPEFFAHYKVADVKAEVNRADRDSKCTKILDFGSGVGTSTPHFRALFPDARIVCADVSRESLEIAQSRFPGAAEYVELNSNTLPFDDETFDVAFTACVFHHIDHAEHPGLISELRRVLKPGGLCFIFEHNPLNPLTVRAVKTCSYDENARLIGGRKMRRLLSAAGFDSPRLVYRIFFPRFLAFFRPLERLMTKLPLGAQYYVTGRKA
jgi:ubiquinone/menaquinone biosynthesis C-methylase UbiE